MKQIQFITNPSSRFTLHEEVEMALRGGCMWVQLRMKDATDEEAEKTALDIQALCKEHHATFIIDDRVELVKKIEADGVHLGKNDMPIGEARRILGEAYIIGGTANTIEDIRNLARQKADYIGCGPFRYTTTKKNLSPIIGLDGYRRIMQQMEEEFIGVPVVAIGGITRDDIADVMQTGVDGIAVSGAVINAENPEEEMRRMIEL